MCIMLDRPLTLHAAPAGFMCFPHWQLFYLVLVTLLGEVLKGQHDVVVLHCYSKLAC